MGGTEGHFPGSTNPCTATEYKIKSSVKDMLRVRDALNQNVNQSLLLYDQLWVLL